MWAKYKACRKHAPRRGGNPPLLKMGDCPHCKVVWQDTLGDEVKAGPVTRIEKAVQCGVELYDAAKDPVQKGRDISIKVIFAAIRRIVYRRK